jgi:hypothetical protein
LFLGSERIPELGYDVDRGQREANRDNRRSAVSLASDSGASHSRRGIRHPLDGKPVAKLVPELPRGVPIAGRCKGMLVIHAADDEHLKDFAEYMP